MSLLIEYIENDILRVIVRKPNFQKDYDNKMMTQNSNWIYALPSTIHHHHLIDIEQVFKWVAMRDKKTVIRTEIVLHPKSNHTKDQQSAVISKIPELLPHLTPAVFHNLKSTQAVSFYNDTELCIITFERVFRFTQFKLIDLKLDPNAQEKTEVQNEELKKQFLEFFDENPTFEGLVHMATDNHGSMEFVNIGTCGVDVEYGNYQQGFKENYLRVVNELTCQRPNGRLTILDGPPGTGKTHIIKGLLKSCANKSHFIIVPEHAVFDLISPRGITAITNFQKQFSAPKPIVLILEDADNLLAPREEGSHSGVSALLNLGDGIIGNALDIRVLATTNKHHHQFDKALLRQGRLSSSMSIGLLNYAEAESVLKRLCPEDSVFEECVQKLDNTNTLASVYQIANDHGWKAADTGTKKKIGF